MFSNAKKQRGTVIVSVDNRSNATSPELDECRQRIASAIAESGVPVTWVTPDISGVPNQLVSLTTIEFGLFVDASWGNLSDRSVFAKHLSQRVETAKSCGQPVVALVNESGSPTEHVDLLVKNRISTVRTADEKLSDADERVRAQSTRFGVWNIPGLVSLPNADRSWLRDSATLVKRAVNREAALGNTTHVVLDTDGLSQAGSNAVADACRAIKYLGLKAQAGDVSVQSLSVIVQRMARKTRTAAPTVSILRKVA